MTKRGRTISLAANSLALVFMLDRLLKLAAVGHFFRRPAPDAPRPWPAVSLVQPVTRSSSDLSRALAARAELVYPGSLEHVFVCDARDALSHSLCSAWMCHHPERQSALVLVDSPSGRIASKVSKLQAAVPHASGAVLCFVDDDILLRPDALTVLVPYLYQPRVGAVFGLACYVDWHNTWSALMSAFVNANALLSYIPLTYATDPFTLTGHCYALRREVFMAVGGFDGMDAGRVDDDHELARRVSAAGLRSRQTPLIYDVENSLGSLHAYRAQMKRWFLFPRAAMLPALAPWQQALAFAANAANLAPPLLGVLALLSSWDTACTQYSRSRATGQRPGIGHSRRTAPPRRGARSSRLAPPSPRGTAWRALAFTLALCLGIYVFCEAVYLRRRTPLRRLPLVLLSALLAPLEILGALVSNDEFEWRGQHLRMERGGSANIRP
jgi:ceramide glucosyltransferase